MAAKSDRSLANLPPASGPRSVVCAADADGLAKTLNSNDRLRPVVVLSIRSGDQAPLIDADTVAGELEGLADVWILPTGALSWRLADQLPQDTAVYGGAARVYPVDNQWANDPHSWPLRWGTSAEEAKQSAELLVSDAMTAAFQAGLLAQRSTGTPSGAVHRGTVIGTVVDRALVQLDNGHNATVWRELTSPTVAIENLVQPGQVVEGLLDAATRRLDVRRAIRPADHALSHYQVGDQVLVQVAKVSDLRLEVELYPGVAVPVTAVQVGANDRLVDLFNPGDVIRAVIQSRAPWLLSFDQAVDTVASKRPPNLLPDGPPWLAEPEPEPPPPSFGDFARRIMASPVARPQPARVARTTAVEAPIPSLPPTPPSPADLAKRRGRQGPAKAPGRAKPSRQLPTATHQPKPPMAPKPRPLGSSGKPKPSAPPKPGPLTASPEPSPTSHHQAPVVPPKPGSVVATPKPGPAVSPKPGPAALGPERSDIADQLHQLTAANQAILIQRDRVQLDLDHLRLRHIRLEEDLESVRRERDFASLRGRETAGDFHQARAQLEHLRRRLRQATVNAKRSKGEVDGAPGLASQLEGRFTDPTQQFDFELQVAWAIRVSPSEKAQLPMLPYTLGPRFLESLEALHGVDRFKVLEVVVDVLTGRAQDIPGRALHRRREKRGGPYLARDDGAVGWRVAIQRGAPSARRLHYWQLGQQIELDKVGVHDEVD